MSNYIIDTKTKLSIESTLSDDQLDNWLWKNNLDYIGVVSDDN